MKRLCRLFRALQLAALAFLAVPALAQVAGSVGNGFVSGSAGSLTSNPAEVISGSGSVRGKYFGTGSYTAYLQTDITNPGGSGIDLFSVITLADLNGRAASKVVAGESIDVAREPTAWSFTAT